MDWDHLAEEKSQHLFVRWLQLLSRESPALPLKLASQHYSASRPVEASDFVTGSYNICSVVTFEDGFRVIVRFPILGRSRFRTEKSRDEIAIMQFLRRQTKLPVPVVLGGGRWGLGPYIVTTFLEGKPLSKRLQDSTRELCKSDPDALNNVQKAYYAMSRILLELAKPTFSTIGTLQLESGIWRVSKRPLTLNMNELVRVGNLPPRIFTDKTFPTASEYFQELATQQLLHLQYQRNDAIDDVDDCRKKYIARCLFRKIAQGIDTIPGPFHLYCDDLRPSNVLVSEADFMISGVIDWEFTYVAPAEFTFTAPWWLLFESPEAWESDLNAFLDRYLPRLHIFLKVLRDCEDRQIRKGSMDESQRLSDQMALSVENGLFWFCLAARKSFMFDDIYWSFLDEKHFGPLHCLDERLSLLSQQEQIELDDFVQKKMQQVAEKRLGQHLTFDEIVDL
ncbi:hypothetical protein PRK78_004886 [Emydomyces testavorans]|uniref:Aminoglycoside phosphotransferase domain-containing protein n=1 Tax=Emydomyces testavorans TaxID=2070801 RepID=A0AAF0IM43_9EURO|nr:hypothetical protein PRK78_004886 [Emydomyces testavorans]